jgi:hypothetical protein
VRHRKAKPVAAEEPEATAEEQTDTEATGEEDQPVSEEAEETEGTED